MTFGQTLRDARRRAQMTQRELAAAVDVDFTYISKLENDRCDTMPSEALVDRLAGVLEQDRDDWVRLARPDDVALLKQQIAALEVENARLRKATDIARTFLASMVMSRDEVARITAKNALNDVVTLATGGTLDDDESEGA